MRPLEPSGPIQVIPPGLLGLLQLKSPSGVNPHVLNNDVQPTLDMLPWWLRANRIVWNLNSGITVAPAFVNAFVGFSPNSIIVPQNQWWYVHSYTLTFDAAAGGTARAIVPAMQWNQVGTLRYQVLPHVGPSVLEALPGASGMVAVVAADFWAPPGSQLGFWVAEVNGADLVADVRGLDYTPCPI